jgi:hypothetical protein
MLVEVLHECLEVTIELICREASLDVVSMEEFTSRKDLPLTPPVFYCL